MKLIAAIVLTLSWCPLFAKDWKINDQHTQVQFSIGYMGVMEVAGIFTQTRGKFEYEAQTSLAKNILFQIAAKSIKTHNKKRDSHLKRADFFAIKQYPWIEITLPSADLSPGTRRIKASVTIKGIQKEQDLLLQVEGIKPDPWDETKHSLFLRVSGELNRTDFGLTWNKELDQGGVLVSDIVRISVDVEANPSDQKLAFSRFYLPSGKTKAPTLINATDLPENHDFSDEVEDTPKEKIKLAAKDSSNPASFVIGFFLFVSITGISLWLKITLQKTMQDKMNWSTVKTEIISDLILLGFVLGSFIMTAPLMGYGN